MTKKKRVSIIIQTLSSLFPEAKIMLHFSNPWELLVAVMLSAQCTDKMVNRVTQTLFKKYKTLDDYIQANQTEFEKDIFMTGFYRMKAKHILATARILKQKFNGTVPQIMRELVTLPGVGRKTANVVLGNAFGVVDGIAVDTHVKRLAKRLALTRHSDPEKIEQDLMNCVPRSMWLRFTYLLIEYGRAYCTARKHNHVLCPLTIALKNKD